MTTETGTITATHLTYTYSTISYGDFETGDLTGWTISTYYTGTATVTTDESATSYGSVVQFTTYDGTDLIALTQTGIDTSDANNISVDYKIITASDDISFGLQIYPGNDYEGWQLISIDCSATTDWTNLITALQTPSTSATISLLMSGGIASAYLDNVKIDNTLSSATIEDNSKTWTPDQFNTDGTFILTSGDVKGFSCKILDTFENYIQVPTTFANIINNITVSTTYYSATEQLTNYSFETGDYTGWEIDDFATTTETEFSTGGITSATKYVGSYGFWYDAWCDGYPHSVGFHLSATITDITEIMKITYWYNIPNIQNGSEIGTYFKVRAATAGDGWGNFVEVENYHTSVTDGWVQGELDVGTLTGEANLHFSAKVPSANR